MLRHNTAAAAYEQSGARCIEVIEDFVLDVAHQLLRGLLSKKRAFGISIPFVKLETNWGDAGSVRDAKAPASADSQHA